ncbi:hypothetical protein NT6N_35020 [Oceaniferula spumae]|uniref:Protein kinase domain-containing protein n=1 Tax=Oceaniferula spumae TaxID=2979115 RepID=A0AAT9FRE5_9BACT
MEPQAHSLNLTVQSRGTESGNEQTPTADSGKLTVELKVCLRHLPERRTAWKANAEGCEAVVKVFHPHAKQKRDADAEWQNAQKLHSADLNIPKPLFLAKGDDGSLAVASAFIPNGGTLLEVLSSLEPENIASKTELYSALLELHARQHNSGCWQKDDHLGNYLCSDGEVYMLDAGSCMFLDRRLRIDERVANLALLTANVALPDHTVFMGCLSAYLDACPADLDRSALSKSLNETIPTAIDTRRKSYFKKTRRACTEFEREDANGRTWLGCRDLPADLKTQLIKNADHYFEHTALLKDGNTCTVVEVEHGGSSYVLKRYNRKPLLYRLRHCLSSPRALRSWTNGQVLRLFGVRTPRPVACLLIKSGLLMDKAYLLMDKISGEPLDTIDSERIFEPTGKIATEFVSRWHELDALNATHGDMKASNFMVDEDGNLSLIDLDGLKFDRNESEHQRRQQKDMARFMRNWSNDRKTADVFRKALEARQ